MNRFRRPTRAQAAYVLMFAAGALLSGWILLTVDAADLTASQEAEQGVVAGYAARCTDSAAASMGGSVRFGAARCSIGGQTYTNPIKTSTADPGVLHWNGTYYMVSTSGNASFTIFQSDNLISWHSTGKMVFNGTHPWGKDRFWAPEMHRVGNRFAVYYSAFDGSRLRVGVATADSPLGPYADLGRPLFKESYSTIDANFFRDDDGRQYVYWKEDEANTRIFGQEVAQDGTTLLGQKVTVLQKGLAWEGSKGIEGSWVTKRNGQYYMFYSGGLYSSADYAVGVARSGSPLGQYTKKGNPILRSGNRWKGPGHNTVVTAGSNQYMMYHAWDRTAGVGDRHGLLDKIVWGADGWPAVASGVPSETVQTISL